MRPLLTTEDEKIILKNYKNGSTYSEIATMLADQHGYPKSKIRSLRRHITAFIKSDYEEADSTLDYTSDESQDTKNVVFKTNKKIHSLEDALEFCDVDLEVWEVERHVFNKWDQKVGEDPMIQVKVWFKRKSGIVLEDVRDDIISEMMRYAPKYKKLQYKKDPRKEHLLELNLFDVHFGKLAWAKESNESYDLKIAEERVLGAVHGLIQKAEGFNISRIVLPTGNDLFNSDKAHPFSSTTAGTPQQEDARWQKTFHTVRRVMVEVIDQLQVIAPVDVPIISGNHDKERCFYLGDTLESWYRNCPNVNIDNSPNIRKYYKWGLNLIGFTHGDKEKHMELPLIMAQEVPELWAATIHREFHLGHFHSTKHMKWISTQEFKGVVVRLLRSLSASDAWHHEKGYIGGERSAEAHLWSWDEGLIANLIHNIENK